MNAVQDAFRIWVKTATGLADNNIFFADQKVERPATTYVTIRVTSALPMGAVDAVNTYEVIDPSPGGEIEMRVEALRDVSVSIQVMHAPSVSTNPNSTAMAFAHKIQTSLRLPSVSGALQDAGIGVYNLGAVQNLSTLLGTDFDGRAQFDVGCYILLTASEFTTFIEIAEIEDDITDTTFIIPTS